MIHTLRNIYLYLRTAHTFSFAIAMLSRLLSRVDIFDLGEQGGSPAGKIIQLL